MENQSYVESVKRTSIVQSFFAQVYGWMFFGLLSTGIVAYYTAHRFCAQHREASRFPC